MESMVYLSFKQQPTPQKPRLETAISEYHREMNVQAKGFSCSLCLIRNDHSGERMKLLSIILPFATAYTHWLLQYFFDSILNTGELLVRNVPNFIGCIPITKPMNIKGIIRNFLKIFLMCVVSSAMAQTTTLISKEKGKNINSVSISLCDKSGSKSITPEAFRKSDRIYFLVEPKEGYSKPVFRESELKEEIPKIVLWQPQPAKYVSPEVNPVIADKRIVAVILAYPKSEIRAHLPFTFGKDGSTSDELLLDETFYDHYPQFKAAFDEANRQIYASDWLEAYYNLTGFLRKEEVAENLRYYSFAKKLTDELPLQVLSKGADQLKAGFLSKLEDFDKKPSKSGLEALQVAAAEVERYLRLTSGYKDMAFESSKSYASISASLEAMVKEKFSEAEQEYSESRFAMLKGQSYLEQRFNTFIDLIYKFVLQSFGSPNVGTKGFSPMLSAGKQEELRQLGWLDDLQEVFYALEKRLNSTPHLPLLPADVIEHLESLKLSQPKPYFEILKLAAEPEADKQACIQLLQTAINTCPVENELASMEIWKAMIDNDLRPGRVSSLVSEGMRQLDTNNIERAAVLFDQALRQKPDDAYVWYLRALAHYRVGEKFAAEAKLDKSLELNPEMIAPLLLKIRLLRENNNFDALNQIFSRPVSNGPNFLFDMAKATNLIEQNKAAEAITVLESGPMVLCPGQTAPHYLIGDAWVALKKPDKARQAYFKTQQINPVDAVIFEEKMRALEKK